MKVGVLFSGGKDSAMALYWAQQKHTATCLITLDSENKDSYMFHTDKVEGMPKLAKKLRLPIVFYKTKGEKEKELVDLKEAIKQAKELYHIDAVASGAIASSYKKTRVDKICKELGLKSFAPYWHVDPKEYMQEMINLGFKIQIVRVAAEGLDETWLNKYINQKFFDKLLILNKKYHVHLAGEGGEYESLVVDGPIFN